MVTEPLAARPRAYQALYGLRIVESANPRGPHYWLDNSSTLSQVQERFALAMIGTVDSKWRVELRIRCVPKDLHELYEKDKSTFLFYYDQVSRFTLIRCYSAHINRLFCLAVSRLASII